MEHIDQTSPINQNKTCILSSCPLLSNHFLVVRCYKCMGLTASFTVFAYTIKLWSYECQKKKKEKMIKLNILVFGFFHFEKVSGSRFSHRIAKRCSL